ncbi:MAG: glycosyltransferase family 2 protein [Chloroflexi bacterium]|nr:glycosyltransferase family 2 protein [Chloroflexota bacterium]
MTETPPRNVDLSIVIPAYNEADRLPPTIDQLLIYLDTQAWSAEIVIVENGSTDGTLEVAQSLAARDVRIRALHLDGRGKGLAVRAGMLAAFGKYLLEFDADASVPADQIPALLKELDAGADIAIGSREAAGAQRVGEPSHRHLMGRVFNLLVRWLALPGISDSQCGFKAFRRSAAQDLFQRQLIDGWGFDVEILYIARSRGYRIQEVPVVWYYGTSSKIEGRLVHNTFAMLKELLVIRRNAMRGRYV